MKTLSNLTAILVTLVYGQRSTKHLAHDQRGWLYASSQTLVPLPADPFVQPPPRWLSPERLAVALIATTSFILYSFFW